MWAPFASAARSSASASAGSPLPWKVRATCERVREPLTISIAGPPGVVVGDATGAVVAGAADPGGADAFVGAAELGLGDALLRAACTAPPQPASASVARIVRRLGPLR